MRKDYEDYDNDFVGNRTSKHCDEDMTPLLTKRCIDLCCSDLQDEIYELRPITRDLDLDEDEKLPDVAVIYELGYRQAVKELSELFKKFSINMLLIADSNLEDQNKE